MTRNTTSFKTTALAIAGSLAFSAALPVATAQAHDRHNVSKHYGYGHSLTRNGHRKFHRTYGPGYQGTQYYRQHAYGGHNYKKKRRKNRDLIAAGVIGLAVGAIIASEASKRKQPSYQPTYNDPSYSPYDYRGTHYDTPGQPVPLDTYETHRSNRDYGDPNVITFNDPTDLQPWTPGWREWCSNRYRSFNANTGTYRGYDGLDHFCVPK